MAGKIHIDEQNRDLAAERGSDGRYYALVDFGRGWQEPTPPFGGQNPSEVIDELRRSFGRDAA